MSSPSNSRNDAGRHSPTDASFSDAGIASPSKGRVASSSSSSFSTLRNDTGHQSSVRRTTIVALRPSTSTLLLETKASSFSTLKRTRRSTTEDRTTSHVTDHTPLVPARSAGKRARAELKFFFDFCPPKMRKGESHTTSNGTREPSDFDLHLSKDLRLERVVHLPSMLDDLAKLTDDIIEYSELPDIPALSGNRTSDREMAAPFPTSGALRDLQRFWNDYVYDEKGVEARYASLARIVLTVAATLEFRLKRWGTSVLAWGLSPSARSGGQATADGFLHADEETEKAPFPEGMREVYDIFRHLGIWEFKSLNAGNREHMNAIYHFWAGRPFDWVTCPHGDDCSIHHESIRTGGHRVTGARCGFDTDENLLQLSNLDANDVSDLLSVEAAKGKTSSKTHTRWMLQQIWAEAVQNDSSFVSLHAGIYEIICFRHRQTQTLYISDLVEVPECKQGYGRLQTGLMLAMIRDAKNRASQLARATRYPRLWEQEYDNTVIIEQTPKSVSVIPKQKKKHLVSRPKLISVLPKQKQKHFIAGPKLETEITLFKLLIEASYKPRLVIRTDLALPFRDEVYFRYGRPPKLSSRVVSGREDTYLKVKVPPLGSIVDSEVYRGIEMAIGPRTYSRTSRCGSQFVLKIATTPDAVNRLIAEHFAYCVLTRKRVRGIATPLGLFWNGKGPPEERYILMLEYVGEKIDIGDISQCVRDAFVQCLDAIHEAGILHGGLREDHLLLDKKENPFIVGFGSSRRISTGRDIFDAIKETEALQSILQGDERVEKRSHQACGVYIWPLQWRTRDVSLSFERLIAPLPVEEQPERVTVTCAEESLIDVDFKGDQEEAQRFAKLLFSSGILENSGLSLSLYPPLSEQSD